MSDSPLRIVPSKPEDSPSQPIAPDQAEPDLAELRRLLIEPEQIQINNILERMNNQRVRAREMSRSLPEAIRLRSAEDESLKEALAPTIVTAFQNSIKKDPRPVAEAISPLMGPAIRRAISAALNGLIQSLDQTLKYSLSFKGLKWRMEALRTGKSFAEVVLSRTLIYRVEQVFLIHKHTGLLLHHVAAGAVSTKDADIVSGMLTAIQDAIRNFARDSFGAGQDEPIEKLDLGDREVWFEPGPRAVLAVVVRGNAPESLRSDFFSPAIEAIHVEMRETLESFDGDTSPFDMIRGHLEECLQSRYQAQVDRTDAAKLKIPAYIWIIAVLMLAALAAWIFFSWRANSRWTNYLNRLKAEPGIIITETGAQNGKRFVEGLRDPLAADPISLLKQDAGIDPNSINSRWGPYQDLDPRFVLTRARNLLEPPPNVELKLENGVLSAVGIAPLQWIVEARKFARAIPGIDSFNSQNLIDEESDTARRQIEGRVIRFKMGTVEFVPGQNQLMKDTVSDMQKLMTTAPAAGRTPTIEIIGHTDSEGDDDRNIQLSRERAERILSMLVSAGVDRERLKASGVGTREPVRPENNEIDKQFNRSVSFKTALRPSPQEARR